MLPFLQPAIAPVLPSYLTLASSYLFLLALAFFASISLLRRAGLLHSHAVFLVDFCCFRPSDSLHLKCSLRDMLLKIVSSGRLDDDCLSFMRKVLERSEIGNETYGPPSLLGDNVNISMAGSMEEARLVLFGALHDLFDLTGVSPSDVNVLIVNCSLFCPMPSLASMVINHFHMRNDIKCFNLSGMGCSAGSIATDLARRLLQVNPSSIAVVVSTESITQSGYTGNDRSKLLPNCLFRMGAAAAMYTNRASWRRQCKYELVHTARFHLGADDAAYRSVYMEEDDKGKVGVTLSKDLKVVAGKAIAAHLRELGSAVLPWTEKLKFVVKAVSKARHVPNFGGAFEHVCVHAGGKAVIDGVQRSLGLSDAAIEPSRMTLYRFGNISSSSIWYELAYVEAKGGMKKGDRVWQLAFGSGFKCSSSVWRSLTAVLAKSSVNAWSDFIDSYPVKIPAVQPIAI